MGTNSISNTVLLLRNYLLSKSAITDSVSDRIHSQHFYDFDNETTPMPLIILDYDGGRANYGMGTQKLIIDVYSYSKTSASQATAIYDSVYTNLNGAKLSHSSIETKGYSYEISRPINGYNSAIRAWYSKGSFSVNVSG